MSQTDPKPLRRINVRMTDEQEQLLRSAADLSGETLTEFVLSAATERAHDVLERSQRIELDAQAFERFAAALDGPVQGMPTLRRHARRPSQIPSR